MCYSLVFILIFSGFFNVNCLEEIEEGLNVFFLMNFSSITSFFVFLLLYNDFLGYILPFFPFNLSGFWTFGLFFVNHNKFDSKASIFKVFVRGKIEWDCEMIRVFLRSVLNACHMLQNWAVMLLDEFIYSQELARWISLWKILIGGQFIIAVYQYSGISAALFASLSFAASSSVKKFFKDFISASVRGLCPSTTCCVALVIGSWNWL